MGTACRGKNPKHPSCKEKGNLLFCVLYAFSTYLYCNNNILQVFGIRAMFLWLSRIFITDVCLLDYVYVFSLSQNSATAIIHVSFFWMLLFMLALELQVLHSDILQELLIAQGNMWGESLFSAIYLAFFYFGRFYIVRYNHGYGLQR